MRHPLRLAALTAALLVLPAAAAWAHPSLDPDQVPVGEPVETTLVVPHGCSTGENVVPEEGEAVPTTRVDLQLVDGVTVEPGEVDGWDVEDDGEAIVWTDAGGATSDPIELPVTLTVEDGTPGDELSISAYQECENGDSYRWTEGAEGTPPVALELTTGETGTAEMDMEDVDGGSDEDATDAATGDGDARALAVDADDGSGGTIAAIVAALVVLLAGGAFALSRSRNA